MNTPITFNSDPKKLYFKTDTDWFFHILCLKGEMTFRLDHKTFNVTPQDFIILGSFLNISDIEYSDDFEAIGIQFEMKFYYNDPTRSNYESIGYLSLLNNPVLPLKGKDFYIVRDTMIYIRDRYNETNHPFHKELVGSYLKTHVLEVFGIHSKVFKITSPDSRAGYLMREFLRCLESDYILSHRNVKFYADKLSVSPHHLSDICKDISGRPATYWIDFFLMRVVHEKLRNKNLTLTQIADQLNFTSLSHLSRFIKRQTGLSPKILRDPANKK